MTTDEIMALADKFAGWGCGGPNNPYRTTLQSAIEAIQADAARLGWIERNVWSPNESHHYGHLEVNLDCRDGDFRLRTAIDAAMKEERG